MSGVASFSGRTRQLIRERYNYRCSVCKQYVVKEAVALGILPSEQYDRTDPDNGTLQYFTKGLLVLDRLRNKKDMPASVRHLFGCYSLVPIFRPQYNSIRYDMFCPMPAKEVPFDDETAFRIFRHDADISASSSGGVISFHATGEEEDGPINFWRLPIPLPVVLYLFLREAHKIETITASTRPEIQLGRDIYAKLSEVSDNLQKRNAKFAAIPPPKTPSADHYTVRRIREVVESRLLNLKGRNPAHSPNQRHLVFFLQIESQSNGLGVDRGALGWQEEVIKYFSSGDTFTRTTATENDVSDTDNNTLFESASDSDGGSAGRRLLFHGAPNISVSHGVGLATGSLSGSPSKRAFQTGKKFNFPSYQAALSLKDEALKATYAILIVDAIHKPGSAWSSRNETMGSLIQQEST
ncbi:hypothetical protein B0H13DRAFT_1921208 [Mycena leptocephala]|nr:hypothetical protein B0H13DRAFT_1921208 [Mycena leptocephala]